jgi:hypothetical protein
VKAAAAVSLSLAVLVLSLPAQVLACPVCSPGRDDATRQAFFDTTIFLSLLPLAMFGGLIYWVVRRIRASEALEGDGTRSRELAPTTEE